MKRIFFTLVISLVALSHLSAQFEDKTDDAQLRHSFINNAFMGGGMTILDYDNDGWQDLALVGGQVPDRLFRNNSDGTFSDVSYLLSRHDDEHITTALVSGDLNNDGCQDILMCNYLLGDNDYILINNCDGTFTLLDYNTLPVPTNSIGATLFDFDQDGLLDIYIIGHVEVINFITDENGVVTGFDHACAENKLYLNKGNFTFEDATAQLNASAEGCALAATVIPINELQSFGIYMANDFGPWIKPNEFLVPNEQGVYTDLAEQYGLDKDMYGMGIAVGDINGDQTLDMYITNLGENVLYEQENGVYIESQIERGVDNTFTPDGKLTTGWGTCFLDADNDTDQDIFVANGTVNSPSFIAGSFNDPNQLFLQKADGTFQQTFDNYGIYKLGPNLNRGGSVLDYDNDGDQDILVSYINLSPDDNPDRVYKLYENQKEDKNWVNFDLQCSRNEFDCFGSQVTVYSGGESLLAYKYSGGTFASQNSGIIHFGLGDFQIIDSVKVVWSDYTESIFTDLPVNEFIRLYDEGEEFDILGCLDTADPLYNAQASVNYACTTGAVNTEELEREDISAIITANSLEFIGDDIDKLRSISLHTNQGQLVIEEELSNSRNQIEISNLNPGIYIYILEMNSGNKITGKVTKF